MLPEYKKKANTAAVIWFIFIGALIVAGVAFRLTRADGSLATDTVDYIAITLVSLNFLVLGYASWVYAKAKGYSGIVGVALLLFLHALGLLILLLLKDKHREVAPATPATVGSNPPAG